MKPCPPVRTFYDCVVFKATEFRQAIVDALPIDDVVLDSFPDGTCGDVSPLLGEYLYESGLGEWQYRVGWRNGRSHAWIECDGLIVDITADQFDEVDDPVIVTTNSPWHQGFETHDDSHPARIGTYDEATATRLASIYNQIILS